MSRIDDLLARLAPSGVEFRSIGDIANIKNGRDHKHLADGDVPVFGSGGVMRMVDESMAEGPSVLIPRKGSLSNIFYVEGPFWVVDTIFRTQIDERFIVPKFLYHLLVKMKLGEMNQAGGVPSQTQSALNRLRIPVPPLEIQREIVRVLDTFTQLEAELEAELEARRRQYEHYRDQLLTFTEGGVCMGEVGSIFGGLVGKSKRDFESGNSRYVSYVNIFNNVAVDQTRNDFVRIGPGEKQRRLMRGDVLFTASSESIEEVGMSSVVVDAPIDELYLNSFSIGYRFHEPSLLLPEYSKHLFRSKVLRDQLVRTASGVTRFNVSKARLAKVRIPVPPHNHQRRIASILDHFSELATDLTSGLPAELAARRKQYEYYRDKLLTFDEAPA